MSFVFIHLFFWQLFLLVDVGRWERVLVVVVSMFFFLLLFLKDSVPQWLIIFIITFFLVRFPTKKQVKA